MAEGLARIACGHWRIAIHGGDDGVLGGMEVAVLGILDQEDPTVHESALLWLVRIQKEEFAGSLVWLGGGATSRCWVKRDHRELLR